MRILRLPTLAAITAVITSLIIFSSETLAGPSSTPCSKRYKQTWKMPLRSSDVGKSIRSVISRSEFSPDVTPRGATNRVSVGRAPDGSTALQMNIRRGANKSVTFLLDPLGNKGVDAACLSLKAYFPPGFEWPKDGGQKLAFGMWGGSRYNNAGGVSPSRQKGWTVRNVHSKHGFRLYSYHLNRRSRFGQQGAPVARWTPGRWHTGRWHNIEMEVVMNTPGRANGYAQIWLDGRNRRTMNNLMFRRSGGSSRNWGIRGLFWNEMWGGDESNRKNWSPRNQKMWYKDYRLYTKRGGVSVSQDSSSSRSSSSSGNVSADLQAFAGKSPWTAAKHFKNLENKNYRLMKRYSKGSSSYNKYRSLYKRYRAAFLEANAIARSGGKISGSSSRSTASRSSSSSSSSSSKGSSSIPSSVRSDLRKHRGKNPWHVARHFKTLEQKNYSLMKRYSTNSSSYKKYRSLYKRYRAAFLAAHSIAKAGGRIS